MARARAIGLPRRALPIRIGPQNDAQSDRGRMPGVAGPGHGRKGTPRTPKRWRLFVGNGATSAFFRESDNERVAPPPQPARSRPQGS